MREWFISFETNLAETFGYRFVVHFEDTVLFIAGIFLGMIIMVCLSGRVVFKLNKVKNLGSSKVKLIKIVHDGDKYYVADPQSIGESIETLLLVIFRPKSKQEYSYRDEKKTKRFLVIIGLIGILFFILALLCISTVLVDNIGLSS